MSAKPSQLGSPSRPTNVRWLIFALACSTSFILYLHRYTWGFMKRDVAEEFDWDPATLGMLDSCFGLSYAIGQIPFGVLGDWFGPASVLGSTIALWSLAMGATALATGLTSMYIVRFMFGLMQSGCYSNLNKATKTWFAPNVRTTVQGWIASFFGRSGGAMANILFGSVLIAYFGLHWRDSILIFTLLGLAFAVVFVWLFRNSPATHPWANEAEAELVRASDPDAAVATRSKLNWSKALRSGNMLVFLFQQFTSAFADNLYPYWIPLFLLVQKGVDTSEAGVLASLPLFGGAVGGMLGGTLQSWLIARTGNHRWVRSLIGCTGKMLAAVLMFASLAFDSALVILVFFAFVKFFGDWSQPTVWGTTTDIGGRNAASVFSAVNTVGSVAGFVAGPAMGALILVFSLTGEISSERHTILSVEQIESAKTEQKHLPIFAWMFDDESDRARETHVTTFALNNKAVSGSSISGTLFSGGEPVAEFVVNQQGAFEFSLIGEPDARPLVRGSTVQSNKGEITIAWNAPPARPGIEVNYRYTLYGSGWTALFVALGLIYLA